MSGLWGGGEPGHHRGVVHVDVAFPQARHREGVLGLVWKVGEAILHPAMLALQGNFEHALHGGTARLIHPVVHQPLRVERRDHFPWGTATAV